jgi:hypothetical protein
MKGMAAMLKMGAPAPKAKTEPADGKSAALRAVIEAIKDGDVDGAAKALGVAVRACSKPDEDDEEESIG